MSIFGCSHKYGKIENGYQYCVKCGVAKAAPLPDCQHQWTTITEGEVKSTQGPDKGRTVGCTYLLKCKLCGDYKNHKMGIIGFEN